MFYDKFKLLCERKGVSPKRAVTEMGMSNSLATKWKNTNATPNSETLKKVAEYFDVSVAYLLGTEEKAAAEVGSGIDEKYVKYLNFILDASERDLAIIDAMIEAKKKEGKQ